MVQLKKDWQPSETAFRQLLSWLDEGTDSAGEKYLEIRRRLELYFDRKNCPSPGELADQTLNRVARKLDEMGAITGVTPLHYCYIVAKFVFLESLRDGKHLEISVPASADPPRSSALAPLSPAAAKASEDREKLASCLDHCLQELSVTDREMILEYYRGQLRDKIESRSGLAARLGLSPNALTIKACRVRQKLEACVRARLEKSDTF
jgi:DNA-directed RNA polymerase specialized sigma24 family protein